MLCNFCGRPERVMVLGKGRKEEVRLPKDVVEIVCGRCVLVLVMKKLRSRLIGGG